MSKTDRFVLVSRSTCQCAQAGAFADYKGGDNSASAPSGGTAAAEDSQGGEEEEEEAPSGGGGGGGSYPPYTPLEMPALSPTMSAGTLRQPLSMPALSRARLHVSLTRCRAMLPRTFHESEAYSRSHRFLRTS